MTIVDAGERLISLLSQLNEDEMLVLEHVADGLVRGRAVYGPLDLASDPRDWGQELAMELRDALVYAAAREIAATRRRELAAADRTPMDTRLRKALLEMAAQQAGLAEMRAVNLDEGEG